MVAWGRVLPGPSCPGRGAQCPPWVNVWQCVLGVGLRLCTSAQAAPGSLGVGTPHCPLTMAAPPPCLGLLQAATLAMWSCSCSASGHQPRPPACCPPGTRKGRSLLLAVPRVVGQVEEGQTEEARAGERRPRRECLLQGRGHLRWVLKDEQALTGFSKAVGRAHLSRRKLGSE